MKIPSNSNILAFLAALLLAPQAAHAAGATVSLSSLDITTYAQGWGKLQKNKDVDGGPLSIGGQVYTNGLGTHAPGYIALDLGGGSERFTAKVGANDLPTGKGSVEFIVRGDGKVLWRSGVMRGGEAAKSVDVSVKGVRILILQVTDGKDGMERDHADWAEAALEVTGTLPKSYRQPPNEAVVPDFQSKHLAVSLSRTTPAFSRFAVDSLGQGKLNENPVLAQTGADGWLELDGQIYKADGKPVWSVTWNEGTLTLSSDYAADAPPFVLNFKQKANHATLLGLMKPGERQMSLPCVLHMPGMGTVRITGAGKLDYDARRWVGQPFVRIGFPPATAEQKRVEYRFEVTAIHPEVGTDPRYDGVRRDWLNIFQVNPRMQMLANNSSSDPCSMCLWEYSDIALHTPPLADGLTANDLVRMTLDRYLTGAKGYGQIGFGSVPGYTRSDVDINPWPTPWTTLDTLPSFLIAACNYVQGASDMNWARANYDKLAAWGREMFASDKDGNGLIEYPATGNFGDRARTNRRPANWWDTVNFGHEDALSNALAYRAALMFTELARKLKHAEDAEFFAAKAAKLRAAYAPAFLNPETGVLAGWKSADGQLHDSWFTYIQGMAITYGLLDDKTANSVMDRLLAKMKSVGYTNFALGLPGNLVPIKKGDYILENYPPQATGEPRLDDGSDGFQYYENGAATGCWAYFTVKALYKLGRVEDARRIYYPMLEAYKRGEFMGFDANGKSRDWRDWKGVGNGYEGLLVDNFHPLLAVLDDMKAKPAAK